MTFRAIIFGVLSACFVSTSYAQDSLVTGDESVSSDIILDETNSKEVLTISEDLGKIRPEGKRWYMEVAVGYGIPFLPVNRRSPLLEIGDKDWYQRNQKELSVKPLIGTNGGGLAGNVTIGHMFNKNIGLDATFTIAKHPERLDARMDVLDPKTHYFASQRTMTTAAYFAPHLVLKSNKGKFGVTAKAGIFMPFYGSTVSYAKIRDRSGRMINTLTGLDLPGKGLVEINFNAKTITSYNPTIGVSTSIAFDYILNERVTLFARARVAAYTISLKETIFDELQMDTKILGIEIEELGALKTKINSVDEAPEFLRTIIYRNEITLESNTARYGGKADMDKPMEELGIRYNASSLYFNIGVNFSFDRVEKRLGKKNKKNKKNI